MWLSMVTHTIQCWNDPNIPNTGISSDDKNSEINRNVPGSHIGSVGKFAFRGYNCTFL